MAKTGTDIPIGEKQQVHDRPPSMQLSSHLPEELARSAEKEKKMQKWLEDNREAIAEYNERIEREGTFAENYGVVIDS